MCDRLSQVTFVCNDTCRPDPVTQCGETVSFEYQKPNFCRISYQNESLEVPQGGKASNGPLSVDATKEGCEASYKPFSIRVKSNILSCGKSLEKSIQEEKSLEKLKENLLQLQEVLDEENSTLGDDIEILLDELEKVKKEEEGRTKLKGFHGVLSHVYKKCK